MRSVYNPISSINNTCQSYPSNRQCTFDAAVTRRNSFPFFNVAAAAAAGPFFKESDVDDVAEGPHVGLDGDPLPRPERPRHHFDATAAAGTWCIVLRGPRGC
jgi:hypothetical protein